MDSDLVDVLPTTCDEIIDYYITNYDKISASDKEEKGYYTKFFDLCKELLLSNKSFSFLNSDNMCRDITNGPTKCYIDLLLTIITNAESYDNDTIQKLIQLLNSLEEGSITFNIIIPFSRDSRVFRVLHQHGIRSKFNPHDGTDDYCSNFYDDDDDDDAAALISKGTKGTTEFNGKLSKNGAGISNSRVLELLKAIQKKRAAADASASAPSSTSGKPLYMTISKKPRSDNRPWCKYIFTEKGCTRDPNDMDGSIKHYHRFKHPGKDVRNMQFILSNGKAVLSKKWRGGNAVSIKSRKSKYTRYHKHKHCRRSSSKHTRRRTKHRRH